MALYNEILVGRFNKALTKLFGIKGPAPAPQLAGEITPAISMFYGVENRILESWDLFGIGDTIAATVGQTNGVRFRLSPPVSSTIVGVVGAVFEKLTVSSLTAQEILLSTSDTNVADFAAVVFAAHRDQRARVRPTMNVSNDITSAAPLVNVLGRFSLQANVMYDIIQHEDQQIPLIQIATSANFAFGTSLQINGTVANSSLNVTAWWRERLFEESEMRP